MNRANGRRNGNGKPGGASGEVAGLFAGIGGIELGLERAGFGSSLLCELDESASAVLKRRFPTAYHIGDVGGLRQLRRVDVLTAGFPCQDLSIAGTKRGINGTRSSLVTEVFRLLEPADTRPKWLLLENVPYMLHLDRGDGMKFLTEELDRLGFAWAYRVVDARAFGLPQRRPRVLVVASGDNDPREVLFADEAGDPPSRDEIGEVRADWAYGFYWTEGRRGLGWAGEAVPPIKGGSGLGIPSPPGIWIPRTGEVGTPDIRDAERLQGFAENWTKPAGDVCQRRGTRWKLVGNAVAAPMAEWVGRRLAEPGAPVVGWKRLTPGTRWPKAAWGAKGEAFECAASPYPVQVEWRPLSGFLHYPLRPLSAKATAGFLKRAREGGIRFPDGFLESLAQHLERMNDSMAEV